MNESMFEELVNLYFDHEISAEQFELLKKELAASSDRLREFKVRCQLHKATCVALSTEPSKMTRRQFAAQDAQRVRLMPALRISLGAAACIACILMIAGVVIREPENSRSVVVKESGADVFGRAGYAERESPEPQPYRNISLPLDLASLTPEVVALNPRFGSLDTETQYQQEVYLQPMVWQVDRYMSFDSVPDPQLIEPVEPYYGISRDNRWPVGFKSSLAGF